MLSIVEYLILLISLLGITIALYVFSLVCSPVIKITESEILIKDFLFPFRFKRGSIKSTAIHEHCPNIVSQDYLDKYGVNNTSMVIKKKSYKGLYNIMTKSGRKTTAFLFVRNVNKPCVEIKTAAGLYYVNYKDEDRTREIYNGIIGFMAYPADIADERNDRDYSVVQRLIRIFILTAFPILDLILLLLIIYQIINN